MSADTPDQVTTFSKQWISLASWGRSKGATWDGAEPRMVKGRGVGVYATEDIKESSTFITVPASLLYSIDDADPQMLQDLPLPPELVPRQDNAEQQDVLASQPPAGSASHGGGPTISGHGIVALSMLTGGFSLPDYDAWRALLPSLDDLSSLPVLWPALLQHLLPAGSRGILDSMQARIDTDWLVVREYLARHPDMLFRGARALTAGVLPGQRRGAVVQQQQQQQQQRSSDSSSFNLLNETRRAVDFGKHVDVQGVQQANGAEEEFARWRQAYLHYWLLINTRSFFHASTKFDGLSWDNCVGLVPLIDMFNHGSDACHYIFPDNQTTASLDDSPAASPEELEQRIAVIANRDYAAGEELLFSYGAHSEDFLLVQYGFLLGNAELKHRNAKQNQGNDEAGHAAQTDSLEFSGNSLLADVNSYDQVPLEAILTPMMQEWQLGLLEAHGYRGEWVIDRRPFVDSEDDDDDDDDPEMNLDGSLPAKMALRLLALTRTTGSHDEAERQWLAFVEKQRCKRDDVDEEMVDGWEEDANKNEGSQETPSIVANRRRLRCLMRSILLQGLEDYLASTVRPGLRRAHELMLDTAPEQGGRDEGGDRGTMEQRLLLWRRWKQIELLVRDSINYCVVRVGENSV